MTNGSKLHPCRKIVLGVLDKRLAKVLKAWFEGHNEGLIGLDELYRLINEDGGAKIHKAQLRKRLLSLTREEFVKLHKKDSSNPTVGKGQFFVNFLFED